MGFCVDEKGVRCLLRAFGGGFQRRGSLDKIGVDGKNGGARAHENADSCGNDNQRGKGNGKAWVVWTEGDCGFSGLHAIAVKMQPNRCSITQQAVFL